ncbi:uncharacterized protein JCM15063_003236 [Sporobolomyces koalae]|uniref:uncharacterized protein n=1 Tax=Sporobolomyces koalae TaxID=500713 RepID=UPI003172722E
MSPSVNAGTSSDARRPGNATSGSAPARPRRRTGKGRGRMMMIKVFYSLQSPRFGSRSSGQSAQSSTPSSAAPSPDFFAVLDPSLSSSSTAAATPAPPPQSKSNPATDYSCIARLSAPVWVQVLAGRKSASESLDEKAQFGRITLKTCLSAICISRPELVIDSTKDFSVSAVDPYESSHRRQASSSTAVASKSTDTTSEVVHGLVEGKGMLSWTLAEKKEGTTMVCGKITGSEIDMRKPKRRKGDEGDVLGAEHLDEDDSESGEESEETLEVFLQLCERDAFTQGQFLDCLRSYHNPVQQLQSELSEMNSSPPKLHRYENNALSSSASSAAWQSTASGPVAPGDPVKRKRPQSRQSLPLSASTTALPLAPASAFAGLPNSSRSPPQAVPAETVPADAAAETPDLLALLTQIVSASSASNPTSASAANLSLDPSQAQLALQNLAKLCGLPVPSPISQSTTPAMPEMPPSTQILTSTSGPMPQTSTRPPKTTTANNGSVLSSSATRKKREHFTAIDQEESRGQGKNNPRDSNGCSNCRRKKSTVWREGIDAVSGQTISVCNACGTFFNKNGYHRSKNPNDVSGSKQHPAETQANASSSKPGRPLSARLTATCEADLTKRKARKRLSNGSPDSSATSRIFGSGIIPPLSPSKHVGPRSPSLAYGFSSSSRSSSTRASGIMSSPGRSPRLRHRQVPHNGAAATSPLRAPADTFAQDGGFDFAALFGSHGSPSPRKRTLSGNQTSSGGATRAVPNYLLTASPGTALDRILNDTSIDALASLGEPMQVDQAQRNGTVAHDAASNPFNFLLEPGSPIREKENERPRASTAEPSSMTAAPVTDAESFENVLSSLRRDFNNRLSSNALTAPSSPIPSSPCVQPRTSSATPGSKGKAPLSSGRAAPSIFDSATDSLVAGIVIDRSAAADADDRTPQSDLDPWSPPEGQNGEDKTLTFDSLLHGTADKPSSRPVHRDANNGYDLSHLLIPNRIHSQSAGRRAAFLPPHLVPASDATDFDLGSLPPSSPPQLPSETFPTPSDFDGVTPGTEGGDIEDRERSNQEEHERLTIEAVAQKVASEPNQEAREMVMALLQSVGDSKSTDGATAVELPGMVGGDKITLDRTTVDKLLSLISANPSTRSPAPAATTEASGGGQDSESRSTRSHPSQESPDLGQIDFFKSFETSAAHPQSQAGHKLQHSEQMNGLYSDLFSHTQF